MQKGLTVTELKLRTLGLSGQVLILLLNTRVLPKQLIPMRSHFPTALTNYALVLIVDTTARLYQHNWCDDDRPPFCYHWPRHIRRTFSKLKEHKAPGPDGITPTIIEILLLPISNLVHGFFLTGPFVSVLYRQALKKEATIRIKNWL